MKIAFVVQRYGLEVNGGAELLARWLAEHLLKYFDIDIITTTAMDYNTWKPHYPEGKSEINGVTIHRFNVSKPRNMFYFDLLSKFVFHLGHPAFLEKAWMDAQGPYCPDMIEFIKKNYDNYDIFLFITYLYAHTHMGLPAAEGKVVLIPAAHDEPPLRLSIFKDVFRIPSGFIYNTIEEKELLSRRFDVEEKPGIIAGVGINLPDNVDPEIAFEKFPQLKGKDYIIFVGRVSTSKDADVLVDYFLKFREETGREIYLVILGKGEMIVKEHPAIVLPGFVSEDEKFSFIKNARALVNPSRFESLSMVLLEAWLMETPVMVSGKCEVTRNQTVRSGGGLSFADYDSFQEGLIQILDNREKAHEMGVSGRKYTEENYSWQHIEEKISEFLKSILKSFD
ncbi:MAG: glycosyltransferase family 4 protein [Candidatus Eremiobacteraeota bacterium]|nr:glycosyltransferase family 4 protein [Candidatus Eremiobacteraeota bacterium]